MLTWAEGCGVVRGGLYNPLCSAQQCSDISGCFYFNISEEIQGIHQYLTEIAFFIWSSSTPVPLSPCGPLYRFRWVVSPWPGLFLFAFSAQSEFWHNSASSGLGEPGWSDWRDAEGRILMHQRRPVSRSCYATVEGPDAPWAGRS